MSDFKQTKRIYDEDAYQITFEAVVLDCVQTKKGYEIILDQTCFFPEEGGQSADQGSLLYINSEAERKEIQVSDVQIDKTNVITHICNQEIPVGVKVAGTIDWNKRFSDMQQHSGEHIVSGLVYSTFGYHNVGFHLSQKEVTMDFDGILTEEDVAEIERKANQAVYSNLEVLIRYPDDVELAAMDYRSKKELEGPIRIVTFPGYDVCACCAPHVRRTGEIGLIKVVHLMNYKGGVRLNLLCGARAVADFQEKQNSVTSISNALSAKASEVSNAVAKLLEDSQKMKNQIVELQRKEITYIASNISEGEGNICLFEKNLEPVAQRELVNLLVNKRSGFCGVFVGSDVEGYRYIVSGQDAREMNQKLKEGFAARGGGSAEMVQGSLLGMQTEIEKLFG